MPSVTRTQGQPLNLEVRLSTSAAPTRLRLRLKGPDGQERMTQIGHPSVVQDRADRAVWRYIGVVDQPGTWEYEWKDVSGFLSGGILRVLGTGF